MNSIDLSKVPQFYHSYINLVKAGDINQAFEIKEIFPLLESLSSEKWDFRYAEGKWSIKEMVQHIIDTERIFTYRALCIAREDTTPLPGFDENEYALASQADKRKKDELLEEYKVVRKSAELLFASFSEGQLESVGISNGKSISVKAIGYILIGHAQHHFNILNERYLK